MRSCGKYAQRARWQSSSTSDTSTSAFSLARTNRVSFVTLVCTVTDSGCKLQAQPAPLFRKRNIRIDDRHLHNVFDALKLTRQSQLREFLCIEETSKLFPVTATTWASRTRDSPGCVLYIETRVHVCNMIVVIAT